MDDIVTLILNYNYKYIKEIFLALLSGLNMHKIHIQDCENINNLRILHNNNMYWLTRI